MDNSLQEEDDVVSQISEILINDKVTENPENSKYEALKIIQRPNLQSKTYL